MHGTRSLQGILPRIHHPLPLTETQSQRLLNALKTTFRSKLDHEHGWEPETTTPAAANAANADITNGEPSPSSRPHRPTDRHLHAILSNPLFAYEHTKPAVPRTKRDPMDVFDEAVAKGMMTRKAATGCLAAKRRQILMFSDTSLQTAMADSGAGRRVVQWLRMSGEERSGQFLSDRALLEQLIPYMVVEGLEEIVWGWADRLARESGQLGLKEPDPEPLKEPAHKVQGDILSILVGAKATIMRDRSLNGAYQDLLRAHDTWRWKQNVWYILFSPWRALSWHSTMDAWDRPPPSEVLFDKYLALEPQTPRLRTALRIDRPHLDLHHPTRPSPDRALGFFRDFSTALKQQIPPPKAYGGFADRVSTMGLDTAKYLSQLGRDKDAEWVLNLVQSHFQTDSGESSRLQTG